MNFDLVRRGRSALAATALVGALLGNQARAEDFYQGKTITIVVGTDAGGGFDVYGRALGRHMSRHIPGNPNMVVQNMPGAGSMKAAEYLYSLAPKDGTSFAILFPGALLEPLISPQRNHRYDPTKYEYLGSADSGTRLCVTSQKSRIKTFADAQTIPSTLGGVAAGSSTVDDAYTLNALAGAKFKIVTGYKSTVEIVLAIERGEVDGVCGYEVSSIRAQRPDWIGNPAINFIVQWGLEPNGAMNKLGVPTVWEFVSDDNRAAAELVVSQLAFGRPFAAPPSVPAAQLKTLRDAFMATMADPQFLADARKSKLDINPKSGEAVGAIINKMYGAPKDVVARMSKAMRP